MISRGEHEICKIEPTYRKYKNPIDCFIIVCTVYETNTIFNFLFICPFLHAYIDHVYVLNAGIRIEPGKNVPQ